MPRDLIDDKVVRRYLAINHRCSKTPVAFYDCFIVVVGDGIQGESDAGDIAGTLSLHDYRDACRPQIETPRLLVTQYASVQTRCKTMSHDTFQFLWCAPDPRFLPARK